MLDKCCAVCAAGLGCLGLGQFFWRHRGRRSGVCIDVLDRRDHLEDDTERIGGIPLAVDGDHRDDDLAFRKRDPGLVGDILLGFSQWGLSYVFEFTIDIQFNFVNPLRRPGLGEDADLFILNNGPPVIVIGDFSEHPGGVRKMAASQDNGPQHQ